MAKVKYYYDTKTLSYKRIELSTFEKIRKVFAFFFLSSVLGIIFLLLFLKFFDSPKEKSLNTEINQLQTQYKVLQKKMNRAELVLDDIQKRDDNIYRVIFEADPIPTSIRKAGYGGVNRYINLSGYTNSELMISATKKIDQINKQLYIQSKSFDHIIELAKNKQEMLACIPAIQPVANKDLRRMASGYGYRIHPIYKTRKMHHGMDFTAKTGTPIYATGNGTVEKVSNIRTGYGKHIIIDHGYGYKTLYAHNSKNLVTKGQKVNRGDVIAHVGSTGLSTSPHLHYEVHKDGKKINPVNFYYNDLTPEQYEKMLIIASQYNQSFD
tara:strand:+ start:16217 stop:17188 length:972 start_codon:yes stop_codon:yes gene_type:complete